MRGEARGWSYRSKYGTHREVDDGLRGLSCTDTKRLDPVVGSHEAEICWACFDNEAEVKPITNEKAA
jgi:hypothetical protein